MRSSSGQFVAAVRETRPSRRSVLDYASTNSSYLRLDATLMSVSGERIRQLIARDLGLEGAWKGKIYLSIRPAQTIQDEVVLGCERMRDGWRYGLEFPEVIEKRKFLRAITQVVLTEHANRRSAGRSAEIPTWLVEGLLTHLMAMYETEIMLSSPRFSSDGNSMAFNRSSAYREKPLKKAHQVLKGSPALSFQQLCWISAPGLSGVAGELYGFNAQVFLTELLRLRNGQSCLQQFLEELPQFYNWQLAFLKAFKEHFQRPLDVEKWWALQLAHFTGRSLGEIWSDEESWLRLDEVLGVQARVRLGTNDVPRLGRVTLQVVISEWSSDYSTSLLGEKVAQLDNLRLRTTPLMSGLADSYRNAIAEYLSKTARFRADTIFKNKGPTKRVQDEAIKELDALDVVRSNVRQSMLADLHAQVR